MNDFLIQGAFIIAIQSVISVSVFSVFLAIFLDFALYSRKENVQREKKSIVETGTMTLFFIGFYMVLKSRIGYFPLSNKLISSELAVLGTAIIFLGAAMNIKGRLNLGRNWANHIKIYEEHSLVQSGMYKWVRHPLYASIIYMFYGACLVYKNTLAFGLVTLIFVPFMTYRAKQEEELLSQRFLAYNDYRRFTGMFFPKILKRREG